MKNTDFHYFTNLGLIFFFINKLWLNDTAVDISNTLSLIFAEILEVYVQF